MNSNDPIHIPKTRNGGVFSDSKDVKLHANDFDWETKVAELSDAEKALVRDYLAKCMSELSQADSVLTSTEIPPKPWESHFSSSKHHFPLKNYVIHAFPLLRNYVNEASAEAWVIECGCGTGSTLLPIMRECENSRAHFVGFDISPSALAYFKNHEVAKRYVDQQRLTLFPLAIGSQVPITEAGTGDPARKRQRLDNNDELVADALAKADPSLQNQKFDAVFLVFVLSALPTVNKMLLALRQLRRVMKPDGILLFRDYALPDHNFFRFLSKMENEIRDVAFAKGDSTTQAFFHIEFAVKLFEAAGFVVVDEPDSKLLYHCNRIENRKNGKRMDKIFINGTFKLAETQ
jgi:methyltransferase-like protein 6